MTITKTIATHEKFVKLYGKVTKVIKNKAITSMTPSCAVLEALKETIEGTDVKWKNPKGKRFIAVTRNGNPYVIYEHPKSKFEVLHFNGVDTEETTSEFLSKLD